MYHIFVKNGKNYFLIYNANKLSFKFIHMKSIFLIFHGFSHYSGISKKISYQKEALEQCGVETQLCYLDIDKKGYHKRMIDNDILENYGKGITAKIKRRTEYSGLFNYIINNNIDLLYIRTSHNANPFLIRFIKKLKRSGIKSVMEIPTFPYDQEYKMISKAADRFRFFIDKKFRHQLAKYLFRIVTFSDDKQIFGTPTINISNGVDFDQIKIKTLKKKDQKCIHLLGVAEIHTWHGFDRIIRGLANYYKKTQTVSVFFNIVGFGDVDEINNLKKLITKNHLESFVRLSGPKTEKDLDNQFDEADFGIASLGRHRSGITHMKSLKNREYAARGLPFIYSETDDNFDKMPYIMKAPANETPIDIEKIVQFYYSHSFEPAKIRDSIFPELSWNVQMKKIIDNISPKKIIKKN